MRRKRRPGAHVNHERWLVSYADFITLLFAFFVVLYASSQVDKAKMGKLAVAIEGAFKQMGVFNANGAEVGGGRNVLAGASITQGISEIAENVDTVERLRGSDGAGMAVPAESNRRGFTPAELLSVKHELERVLADEINRRDIALHIGPEGLVVSMREVGFFDSGSSVLKPGSEAALARIALVLRQQGAAVRVEGHTDNIPIHTAEFNSNWELSTARATEIIKLLIAKYGLSPERLSAAGYAEFHPVAPNTSQEGRRQNRRLDLVILAAPGQNAPEIHADHGSMIPGQEDASVAARSGMENENR